MPNRTWRSVVVVGLLALSAIPAAALTHDVLGIWFDAAATTDTLRTTAPGQQVTAYLILRDPSTTIGVGGWECEVDLVGPGVSAPDWHVREGVNVDTAPRFQVGVKPVWGLDPGPAVVLATLTFTAPDPGACARFYIHAYPTPSLQDPPGSGFAVAAPLYAVAAAPDDLRPTAWPRGSEALPVAVVNPPADATPVCSAGPPRLAFGWVALGAARGQTVEVANVGGGTLTGSLDLPAGGPFALAEGGGPYALGPGELRRATVRFAPTAEGAAESALAICEGIPLAGTGYVPGLCVLEPAELDFGSTVVRTPHCLDATLRHVSGGPVPGAIPAVCGPFTVESSAGAFLLLPGGSRTVRVCFAPTDTGTAACALDLGLACGPLSLAGRGVDAPPLCGLAGGSLAFGSIVFGTEPTRILALTNLGGGRLAGSIAWEHDADGCGAFAIASGAGPFSLAHGETLRVAVRFAPPAPAVYQCWLATGLPSCEHFFCSGGVLACAMQPDTLDFGLVGIGRHVTRTLTVRNTGVGRLAGSIDSPPPPFWGGGPFSISPGDSVDIMFNFSPAVPGDFTAALDIGPVCGSLVLHGRAALLPHCQVSLTQAHFGSISVGMQRDAYLTISNLADASAPLDGTLAVDNPGFRIEREGGMTLHLPPRESTSATVVFAPTAPGSYSGTVTFGSEACAGVAVTGTAALPEAVVQPDTLDFGSSSGEPVDRTLQVRNRGTAYLDLHATFTGAAEGFSVVNGCGAGTLSPNQSCQIIVRFTARSPGEHCAALVPTPLCPGVACILQAFAPDAPPRYVCSPPSPSFGVVRVGEQPELACAVRNAGGGSLAGTMPDVTDEPAISVVAGAGPFALAAGESVVVRLRFAPERPGRFVGSLRPAGVIGDTVVRGTGWLPGSDEIGVYFDAVGTRTSLTTRSSFEPVTAYVVLRNTTMTGYDGYMYGWTATIDLDGPVSDVDWTYDLSPGAYGMNEETPPRFRVACDIPLAPVMLLARVTFVQDDPARTTAIRVGPLWDTFDTPTCGANSTYPEHPMIPRSGSVRDRIAVVNPGIYLGATAPAPTALATAGGVQLSWPCADSAPGDAWHLWRRLDDGAPVRLTAAPLACAGGSVAWLDTGEGVPAGAVRHYACALVRDGVEIARSPETTVTVDSPPARTALHAVFPNPFNPQATVRFDLARPGRAQVVVFDVAGRRVRTLVDEDLAAATHSRIWDGRDDAGRPVPSGTYYARLAADGVAQLRKMSLVR